MRILLVENDIVTAEMIGTMLRDSATMDRTGSDQEALEFLRLYDYDIVLLDLVLPDLNGYGVVRQMRARGINTPVLILSPVSHPQEKVKAFALGADDVVTKPFDPAELVARVQAVVRRSKGHGKPSLQVGPLSLNLNTREVTVEGRPVHLSPKEYAILELLMLRRGMTLTKGTLLDHLYGLADDEPDIKIIDVFVCKLRKKLAEAGADGVIDTKWGFGYRVRDPARDKAASAKGITARPLPMVPMAS